jgi:hypothetical protein
VYQLLVSGMMSVQSQSLTSVTMVQCHCCHQHIAGLTVLTVDGEVVDSSMNWRQGWMGNSHMDSIGQCWRRLVNDYVE